MSSVYIRENKSENPNLEMNRRLLMDFGFGNFLDKFEGRFGRRATTALLGIIGLGVVSVVTNLVATNVIIPIYEISSEYVSPQGNLKTKYVVDAFWNIVVFLWGIYYIVTIIQRRNEMKDVERYKDQYRLYSQQYDKYMDAVRKFHETIRDSSKRMADSANVLKGKVSKASKLEIEAAIGEFCDEMYAASDAAGENVLEINRLVENSLD